MSFNKKIKLLFVDILADDLKVYKGLEERILKKPYPEIFKEKLGKRQVEFSGVFAPEGRKSWNPSLC